MIKFTGKEIELTHINDDDFEQVYLDKNYNVIELEDGMLMFTKNFQIITRFDDNHIEFLGYDGEGDFRKDRDERNWDIVLEIENYKGEKLWIDYIQM